ncbi:tyrosine-type recombinase/integrase [Aneurinibacillus sp. Ricciae_BoGa-3]|uniref:tyrosine-type recombinase/integrase n=1 Tax=Aneurinibacillus sp. Ricciae_BoGa-3 TaxID=3022697 RepID=UPI0023411CE0|nr:tyrosine-type recombinase/integrase [Aneurinibacillus sp. Ricciae_BoGa-3]WCK54254.1 tyrosine-type recombinase/integrase [Aneurinibacillus sp. Ricciae_BoGa-3]
MNKQEQYERNLHKIDRVCEEAKKKGVTVSKKKGRLAGKTYRRYKIGIKQYARYLYTNYGITDISRAKPRHAEEYIREKVEGYKNTAESVWTIKTFFHSIEFFRVATRVTSVYKGEVRLGDKRKFLTMLKEEKIFRKSKESTVLKATRSECELVIQGILKTRSPIKTIVADLLFAILYTGSRLSACLRLKVEDIDLINGTITFHNDKGGLTHSHRLNSEAIQLFTEIIKGKKQGAPVFKITYRNGQQKSIDAAAKQIQSLIAPAARRAGVNHTDERGREITLSAHSFRKAYASGQYEIYLKKSERDLKKEIASRIRERPCIRGKYKKMVRKINKNTKKGKKRWPNKGELAKFLTSLDIAHSRVDVVRYYISPSKAKYPKRIIKRRIPHK